MEKDYKKMTPTERLLWVILMCSVITSPFVQASKYWSLGNQMKAEIRPYTKTATDPSTTGPTFFSSVNRALEHKFREMHRYCDGQCFYAPDTCATVGRGNQHDQCRIAASIATHNEDVDGDLYCDFLGPDNLRQSFCSQSPDQIEYRNLTGNYDRFYTITLHRVLDGDSLSCNRKWDVSTGRRCRRSEFVGISFLSQPAQDDLEEEDLWYICIVDETHRTRISMWTKISANSTAQQIMGTKPHLESGAGVVYSKVAMSEDTLSLGCQFVIQESNMTLRNPPDNAAFFSNRSNPITVKLAGGLVERNPLDDSIVSPFFDNGSPVPFEVYRGNDIKPTDTIFFDTIQVNLTNPLQDLAAETDLESLHTRKIKELIEKCDKPVNFPELYIACYPPNNQQNCVHTGRCQVMFIVEIPRTDTSFDYITAHLYSLIPEYRSIRKVKRPTGFASVGFSYDPGMGRDVVISCHADGRSNVSVVVSINFLKTNIYPGKVDYNHLVNSKGTYATVHKSRILCSWEMKTEFAVNMFDYEPEYRQVIQPGQSEKLEYNFKTTPVHLLTVAGNRIYPGGKIVHHDHRQVLHERFSKELFLKKANGNALVANVKIIITLLSLNFILCIY